MQWLSALLQVVNVVLTFS